MKKTLKPIWHQRSHCSVLVPEWPKSPAKKTVSVAIAVLLGPLLPSMAQSQTATSSSSSAAQSPSLTKSASSTQIPRLPAPTRPAQSASVTQSPSLTKSESSTPIPISQKLTSATQSASVTQSPSATQSPSSTQTEIIDRSPERFEIDDQEDRFPDDVEIIIEEASDFEDDDSDASSDDGGETPDPLDEDQPDQRHGPEEETDAAPDIATSSSPAPAPRLFPEKGIVVVAPQAGSYNSNAWAANTMFQMNLNDRLGSYFQGEGHPHQGSAWIRYSGSHSALKDESGQLRTKGDRNTVMMGIDMLADSTNDRDQVTIGVMGGYGHYDGKTSSSLAGFGSKGKVEGYGLGLYGTYQQNAETEQGVYVDTWLLWNQFDNRVKGDGLPREKYKSKGMTASLELGYNAKIAEHNYVKYVLQPHAQLTYQHVRSDNFTDSNGTRIEFLNGARMQTTVGLRAAAHVPTGLTSVITPHIEANWLHSTKGYGVRMNNADARMDSGRNAGQLKLGVEGNINQRLSLNVEVFHNQGNAGYHETGGNLMAKYRY